MKNYLLMLFVAIATISCSKKVEVKGNFAGGSPLERIEFVDASGVATLPLVNMGVDAKGSFAGSFEAPKNGMYVMSYAGKTAMVYLKGGQTFNISGKAENFPNQFTITGDAKNNNDFLLEVQKFIQTYAAKINVGELVAKDEANFLKEADKIKTDLEKNIDISAKNTSADSDVVTWKKDELTASVLGLMNQYELNHAQAAQQVGYKPSQKFKDAVAKMDNNSDRLLKNQPIYRNYLLGKLSPEIQTFSAANKKEGELPSSMFSRFLDTKKDISSITKDYLLAYVLSGDIAPGMSPQHAAEVSKTISEKVKDADIKKDLEHVQFVISGPKVGEAVSAAKLIKQDGSEFKLADVKGKPTLVMFYASWTPYISEATIPVLKEVSNFYKSKMDFTYVNLDDTKEQFIKSSNAMLKGFPGNNVYAEGGLNSQFAKDLGIFGFKLPSFIILDKNGKIASRTFSNLGDAELITALDKVSGLKAPTVQPQAQLQNDLLAPKQQAPQPAPAK
jgi:thiol-disulfide isomerase/thioredoxin